MAKKVQYSPPEESRLLKSRAEVEEKLDARVKAGEQLEEEKIHTLEELKQARERYHEWTSYNSTLLKRLFSGDEVIREYSGAGFRFIAFAIDVVLDQEIKDHFDSVHKKVTVLRTIRNKVELYE